ncbi:hypothetical protein A0J61_07001 [Choanephora cucurbitarum]|uniref:Uncharacterized protein n=1 Tax=Choanephora cucurbitarum TaxID=101091 RepID=A0A1C7N8J4_9FUNG|nr:hypothetical protein A0J61_07001 [Choanephora cucurbitarum]
MPEESIPIWAIAIIAAVAFTVIIVLFIHIKKRRNKRLSVYAQADEEVQEKRSVSEESLQTLVTQKHKSFLSSKKQSIDLAIVPTPPLPVLTRKLTKHNNEELSAVKDCQNTLPALAFPQQGFSDKTEVNEIDLNTIKSTDEFVAIELNDPTESTKAKLSLEASVMQEELKATRFPIETNANHISSRSNSIARSISIKHHRLSASGDTSDEKRKVKHGAPRFHSVRGLKSNEHLTITSGSMRRFVRESILVDDKKELPFPSTAAIVSNSSTSRKPTTNTNILDIAGWWDTSKTCSDADTSNLNDNSPLNIIKSSEDSTLIPQSPPQYRASLSNSVFNGTLTRSSVHDTVNALSRQSSTKKSGTSGTLGKSTLKSITTNATQNVNRSIKSLFDSSSKSTNDGSQKMEINELLVENVQESSKTLQTDDADQMADVARNSYGHNLLQEMPESSAKYALSDEENRKTSRLLEDDAFVNNNSSEINDIRCLLQPAWDSKAIQNKNSDIEITSNSPQSDSNPKMTPSMLEQQSDTKMKNEKCISENQEAANSLSVPPSHASTDCFKNPTPTHQLQQTINRNDRTKPQKKHESFRFSSTSSAIISDSNVYFPSPQQSSFDSIRYQSGNSSSNNSTATAVRLSYSMTNQTWNGRTNKSTPRPSVMQIEQQLKDEQRSERAYHSTMQKGRKVRGSIPWPNVRQEKTPAQIERDNYLEGKYSEV